jgi:hypothetical protein
LRRQSQRQARHCSDHANVVGESLKFMPTVIRNRSAEEIGIPRRLLLRIASGEGGRGGAKEGCIGSDGHLIRIYDPHPLLTLCFRVSPSSESWWTLTGWKSLSKTRHSNPTLDLVWDLLVSVLVRGLLVFYCLQASSFRRTSSALQSLGDKFLTKAGLHPRSSERTNHSETKRSPG